MGCNYLSLPEILASGTKVLIYYGAIVIEYILLQYVNEDLFEWSIYGILLLLCSFLSLSFFNLCIAEGYHPDSKCMGPTWGPPGSCRPQMGPMLAPWTLLSGVMGYGMIQWEYTVHEKNYSHVQRHFAVQSRAYVMADFTHILQGSFTGTGAIIWLP